jgi:hypothetical protein
VSTTRICGFLAFAAACGVPLAGLAFVAGPAPGKTGGFGEMTCHECHWDHSLNEPSGRLTLSGVPSRYTPKVPYLITVELVHPDLVLGGFQLSARYATGAEAGTTAGRLRPVDERTEQIADDAGVVYLQHTRAGATAGGKAARWTLEWTAPAAAATVVFHAAGNAANGDDSSLGDYVYTAAVSSEAAPQ